MPRQYQRYTKEELQEVVKECSSFAEVCRRFGKSPRGGTSMHLKLMCARLGIDTSHMTGQAHNRGKRSNKRLPPAHRLVMGNPMDHRVPAHKLRAALLELNVPYKCNHCDIDEWNGQKLVLEVDHIDEQYWNNTKENLQFLCPNCHSLKK